MMIEEGSLTKSTHAALSPLAHSQLFNVSARNIEKLGMGLGMRLVQAHYLNGMCTRYSMHKLFLMRNCWNNNGIYNSFTKL